MTDAPAPSDPVLVYEAAGLTQPKRSSLPESIANIIAGAIATRQIKPGERLIEVGLAQQLGVSRVPVREALKVLEAQGIISAAARRGGYRVVAFDEKTTRDVLEMRVMLETILLRDAIQRCREGVSDLSAVRAAIRQMEIAARIDDRRASIEADLEFHRGICRAAGNKIGETLWETLARHVMIIFSRSEYRETDLHKVVRQHEAFLEFVEASVTTERSESELGTALRDHLLQVSRNKGKADILP